MSTPLPPPRTVATGLSLAILSAVTFGSSGVGAKALIASGWTAGGAVLIRLSGASLVLLIVGTIVYRGRWPRRPGAARTLLTYGAVAMAGTQLAYFNAVRTLDVGVALLIEFLAPVLLLAWSAVRTRVLPPVATLAGAAVALSGLVLVIDPRGAGPLDTAGVLWALAAAVGLSTFFVLSSRDSSGLPALVMAAGGTTVGALLIGLAGLIGLVPINVTTQQAVLAGYEVAWYVPALWLVLLATVVAYLTGIGAISRLGTRVASFVALTEVLAAILIAWLLLSELPGTTQLIGGIMILAGIIAVQQREQREQRKQRARPTRPAPLEQGS